MAGSTLERGAAAEALAADYLEGRGLVVIARNLRCRMGELDLVCLEAEVLVIVEVRQRTRRDFGGAAASVTPRKRRRIIRAAQFYWQREPSWRTRAMRFDVVTLQGDAADGATLAWLKDAFRAT